MDVFNPKIPKEFLWTDLKSMDDFFKLDPVNEYFFEYFTSLREEPFSVTLDAVKVFNEVYYQATRIKYESPYAFYMETYYQEIKADLGWSYSAELVMTMVYWISEATHPDVQPVVFLPKKFIKQECTNYIFWLPFRKCCQRIKEDHLQMKYDFKPKPVSLDYIRKMYVLWADFTDNYNLEEIKKVLNIWDGEEDKAQVAAKIKDSLARGAVVKRYKDGDGELIRLLDSYINYKPCFKCADFSPSEEIEVLDERINHLEDEKQALQGRINELEAENEKLKALLEKKKRNGKARRFTLVEIVNYCKGRVEWNDVKDIVAMLNRLLRKTGTQEDSDLVDGIEEEFMKRKYGDNYYNANVTIAKAEIEKFNDISNNDNVYMGGQDDGEEE